MLEGWTKVPLIRAGLTFLGVLLMAAVKLVTAVRGKNVLTGVTVLLRQHWMARYGWRMDSHLRAGRNMGC